MTHSIPSKLVRGLSALAACILLAVPGAAGVYRTYTCDDAMAAALEKWSDALPAFLAGESIARVYAATSEQAA